MKNNIRNTLKALSCSLLFTTITVSASSDVNVSNEMNDGATYYNLLLEDHPVILDEEEYPQYFSEKSTIKEVLDYQGFSGFSHLMLPVTKDTNLNLNLDQLPRIMTIHHNVLTSRTLDSLNYLAAEVDYGAQIFYPLYPDSDDENKKKDTGFFFFRGEPNAPFAFIMPGGYKYKSLIHEGFPIAMKIAQKGYNAFVLSYRNDSLNEGCEDLTKALEYILKHSTELKVNPNNYSLWGFSIGAQIEMTVTQNGFGSYGVEGAIPKSLTNIFAYPVSYHASVDDVPTFIVVGQKDQIANKTILKSAISNLQNLNINCAYMTLPQLEHGFGAGYAAPADDVDWITKGIDFWVDNSPKELVEKPTNIKIINRK